MKLIITTFLKRAEYEPLKKVVALEIIKKAAKKSLGGLGDTIKNTKKIPGTLLKKIYVTTPGGAARIIFLLQINAKKSILVMIRLKNDKKIGTNMTVDNPKFRKKLERNLESILQDLQKNRFEVMEISS